jgi:hypothetical protein
MQKPHASMFASGFGLRMIFVCSLLRLWFEVGRSESQPPWTKEQHCFIALYIVSLTEKYDASKIKNHTHRST